MTPTPAGIGLTIIFELKKNIFLFEFWRAEKKYLILLLRKIFRTLSGWLKFFEYLLGFLILWNLEEDWKKYEKNLNSCPKHTECMINVLETF